MSSADSCTCQEQCPKDDFCGCIFIYESAEGDEGECRCDCGIVIHPSHLRILPVSARVAINTEGGDLEQLAAFLDKQCEVDVVVPEERQHEKVSLHMTDSSLADVIEAAGLTIRGSGPSGSGY